MSYEVYASMSKSELLVEIDEIISDRVELKAELERVKADSFTDTLKTMSILAETDQHMKDCKTFLEEFKKLSSLKSRLPVNRDGDVIVIGEPQFIYFEDDGPVDVMVHAIYLRKFGPEYKIAGSSDSDYIIEMEDWARGNLSCHSSAESCRAAHETEKGA